MTNMRTPTQSKITIRGKPLAQFIKASYHLITHDIELFGFESSTSENIWHEIMHKALWETEDIPDEATRAWDTIAEDIRKYLELPDEPFYMNYKTITGMKKK